MVEKLQIGRVDGLGMLFSVPRVIVAIETVSKAAGAAPIPLPFNDEGLMHYPIIAQLTSDLRDLMAIAMKNEGSLTVRYLGDLKPTTYPIDTQFFHLNASTADGADFSKILQKALMEGNKEELTFINLANVRDVKIHVGNHRAVGTTDDLRFLTTFCEVLESWANDSASIKVKAR